jgi:predicted RNase H-like nuclease
MSITTYKHRNCIIQTTPSEKFPEMVTITKTPKMRSDFEGRRYLTLEHAHKAIELFESERMIKSKSKYIKSQLQDVVVLEE